MRADRLPGSIDPGRTRFPEINIIIILQTILANHWPSWTNWSSCTAASHALPSFGRDRLEGDGFSYPGVNNFLPISFYVSHFLLSSIVLRFSIDPWKIRLPTNNIKKYFLIKKTFKLQRSKIIPHRHSLASHRVSSCTASPRTHPSTPVNYHLFF